MSFLPCSNARGPAGVQPQKATKTAAVTALPTACCLRHIHAVNKQLLAGRGRAVFSIHFLIVTIYRRGNIHGLTCQETHCSKRLFSLAPLVAWRCACSHCAAPAW